MALSLKTAKIIGSLEGSNWNELISDNGFFLVLEIVSPKDTTIDKKHLIDEIRTAIYQNDIESLASLQKVLSLFADRPEIATLTLGIVFDNVLYAGNIGEGSIYIKRGNKVIKILDKGEKGSGFLQKDDLLLITSKSFNQVTSNEKPEDFLQKYSFNELPEILTQMVLKRKDSEGMAALVVNITEEIPISIIFSPSRPSILNKKQNFFSLSNLKNLLRTDDERNPETEQETKSKKMLGTVAIILIILLIVSIFLGAKNSGGKEKLENYNKSLELISHQFEEAGSLIDLNPQRARTLLNDAKKPLLSLQKQFNKGTNEYKKIQEWLDKIKNQEGKASKVYKFEDVPTYFDLALLRKDGTGSSFALYKDSLVVLDTKNKVVYQLSLKNKQSEIIAGAEIIKDAYSIAIHGANTYVLQKESITVIDIGSKTSKVAVKKDEGWGDIAGIVAFTGNLYLLDKKNNQIWKYIATEDGFSKRTNYLNSDVKPDFEKAQSMVIDGSVWVITGGDVVKFTQGRPGQFKFQGLAQDAPQAVLLFTNDDSKNIYLLDREKGSIVVIEKDGTYKSAYEWNGLKTASSLVVSEEEKKIFILKDSKIYALDIK